LLHYQRKDTTTNALGLASSNSFSNLAHRPHYSNSSSSSSSSSSEQSEKISSSTADLNKELSSSIRINFNSISKNNVNESSDKNNNNNNSNKNLNENKIDAKNPTLKNLTSFSQIVYQSRVKHFVNAVETISNGSESAELLSISENLKPSKLNPSTNKLFEKVNNPTNVVASTLLNAPANSCRVNAVKPKQSITSHFIQRSNEVEYQADRRLTNSSSFLANLRQFENQSRNNQSSTVKPLTDSGLITSFNSASNSSSSSSVSDASTNSSSQLTKSSSVISTSTIPSSVASTDSNSLLQNTPSVKTIAKSYETHILPTYSKPKLFQNLNEMNTKRSNSIIKIINGTKNKITIPSLGVFENQNGNTKRELGGLNYMNDDNKSKIKTPITKYSRHATVNIMSDIPSYETEKFVEKTTADDILIREIISTGNEESNDNVSSIHDDSKSKGFI